MRIFSQNLTNYDIPLPENSIFRINLAWINSLEELKILLKKHENNKIFLDMPIGRTKPPDNRYSLEDITAILILNKNIKYFAISNVNSSNDLKKFINKIPNHVSIVPKIESPTAIQNISEIVNTIPTDEKIVMLDHDDLFSAIIKNNEPSDIFKKYIQQLVDYCNSNKVTLLRTIGVIFSDEEKRISDYMH